MNDGDVARGIRLEPGERHVRPSPECVSQDGVDEFSPSRKEPLCRVHGFVDGGIDGDLLGEARLEEGDAEDVPDACLQRIGFAPVESVDQEIEETPHAQRAVDEEGQQSAVGIAFRVA